MSGGQGGKALSAWSVLVSQKHRDPSFSEVSHCLRASSKRSSSLPVSRSRGQCNVSLPTVFYVACLMEVFSH